MASQYVVDNADMKAVADAIREKGKTSDELVFPDGFVKAVNDISAGSSVEEPYIKEHYDPFEIQGQIIEGYLTSVEMHGYTKIRESFFTNCLALRAISGIEEVTEIEKLGFFGCAMLQLDALPEKLVNIGQEAFSGCETLNFTTIPASVKTIGSSAFQECVSLTSLTFKGTPTSIDSWAFTRCENLTTINVPWSEGEVEGAPWSATEATINYNYTE